MQLSVLPEIVTAGKHPAAHLTTTLCTPYGELAESLPGAYQLLLKSNDLHCEICQIYDKPYFGFEGLKDRTNMVSNRSGLYADLVATCFWVDYGKKCNKDKSIYSQPR